MNKLDLLEPKVKEYAEKLISEALKAGYVLHVTSTFRSFAEQDAIYAQGRTKPGNIVTNAKGGYSLHNYGVAFDIVPIVNGSPAWNLIAAFKKAGEIGMGLGLEWGGTWQSPDMPHFQYLAGYTLEDFRSGRIDKRRFQLGQSWLLKRIRELQMILSKLLKYKRL